MPHCNQSLLAVDSTAERCCLLIKQDMLLEGLIFVTVLSNWRLSGCCTWRASVG